MSDGVALTMNSNVTVKCINKYGKVFRTSKVHNKATVVMVQGLLEFLSGSFTPTITNNFNDTLTTNEISSYVPVKVKFGTVGVVQKYDETLGKYVLSRVDKSRMKTPTFDDYKLQDDITDIYTKISKKEITFDTIEITNYDNTNNSMGLLMQVKLPAGRLVGMGAGKDRRWFTRDSEGVEGSGWSYYNKFTNEHEAMFTELGLYSTSVSTGHDRLLARVLFDGKTSVDSNTGEIVYDIDDLVTNPIVQSDSTSLVIEWRVGIVSIGQNDEVYSSTKVPQLKDTIADDQTLGSLLDNSIETLKIPKIEDGTFNTISTNSIVGRDKLTNIIIPLTITKVDKDAFVNCKILDQGQGQIYYEGTEEEFTRCLRSNIEDKVLNSIISQGNIYYNFNYETGLSEDVVIKEG